MSEISTGIVGICLLVAGFLTGIELGIGMAIIGFLGIGYLGTWSAASNQIVKDIFDTFTNYGFTVIPLFILMGQVAFHSDVARKLYNSAEKFVGHIPGGLAMTTVVGATVFKAMCGSTLATCATFASVAIPEMNRAGYSKKLSTGVVASVGTLGMLIPPSVPLMIYGIITEQSIGKLFLAGIIPGLVIALLFICVILGWVKIDPSIAKAAPRSTWKERMRSSPEFLWVAMIFALVIGGLMAGWFSPTEAGSIGTAAVLLLAYASRKFPFKSLVMSFEESLRTACMVLLLIGGSVVFGHFLAVTSIPFIAADWIANLPVNKTLVMVMIIFIYLLGGSFIDDLAFMILATPIFYPVIIKLGYDPIWFGIMIAITIMVGVIIPPVAIGVFVVKNITGEQFSLIYSGVYPFLLSLVACAILLFLFPGIATWLPSLSGL
ncbi:MAG: Sialic acid TRAP transporter permease protein SiaT [Syntrophorhabdaceae bacterium PtaU1.Bin034]|nr:MAG: Sialic acid TRAP transporter permease protein SiaT [Syntrophorhabdaceae bacterium PtaU1.Bin034]